MPDYVAESRLQTLKYYNADKIASFLHLQDVKGRRSDATSCPVANYLGGAKVNQNSIVFSSGESIVTPPEIAEFVKNFDAGKYPQLQA